MKKKEWKYPVSASIKQGGKRAVRVITQLYQTGVYVCVYDENNRPDAQLNLTPKQAIKYMAQFRSDNLIDGCTSEFGPMITVTTDENGFYKKVER